MKLAASDIWPILYNFVKAQGSKKLAETFKRVTNIQIDQSEFDNVDLVQAVSLYCEANNIEQSESSDSSDDSSIEELQKVQQIKTSKAQQIQQAPAQIEEKKVEIPILNQIPEIQKQQSQEQESQTSIKDQEIIDEQANIKRKSDLKETYENYKRQKFGNILDQQLRQELQDNSVQAKQQYGTEGDSFANKGNNMLKRTKGKDFRKQKGKLKNKTFGIGGKISLAVNSIKL